GARKGALSPDPTCWVAYCGALRPSKRETPHINRECYRTRGRCDCAHLERMLALLDAGATRPPTVHYKLANAAVAHLSKTSKPLRLRRCCPPALRRKLSFCGQSDRALVQYQIIKFCSRRNSKANWAAVATLAGCSHKAP